MSLNIWSLVYAIVLIIALSDTAYSQYSVKQDDPISNLLESSDQQIGFDQEGHLITKPTVGDQISNLPEASKPIMWIDEQGNLAFSNDHFTLPEGQTDNAFHLVVIGDSIAWGNGLNQKDKYYYQIAEWLQEAIHRPVDVAVYAHSGAHISSGNTGESIDANLNCDFPTLIEQAKSIQNADDVDLILVSGGINDVDIMKILNVYTPADEISQRALSIEDPMRNLLSTLLIKCKNAKIIVTNYYPIVTEGSDVTGLALAYGAGVFAVDRVLMKDIISSVIDAVTIKERLIENSYMFFGSTTTSLTNAVLETDNGANRIILAVINFQDSNSYASSDTWLWKLETAIPPKTDDDYYEERAKLCEPIDITNIANNDNYINYINAIGHPNVKGANEYNRSIKNAIERKGLKWLDNIPPTVQGFQVAPNSIDSGEAFKSTYTISDTGGSSLAQVELWRKDESSDWQQIRTNPLAGETGPVSGSFTDSPSAPGKYWYGVHVVDNAGNWNDQKNSNTNGQPSSFEPAEVVVSATEKPSQSPITQGSDQAVPSESILFAGIPLMLNDGYELALKSLDIDGNKIYLELSKDGLIVDSSVIRPPNNVDTTYVYAMDNEQEGDVPIIKVHFKNSFRGLDQNLTTVDSIWQVSESNPSSVILDSNDLIILSSGEPIRLEEGYELALKAVDYDGNKIYLELSKDGQVVDSSVKIPSNEFDEAYAYTKDKGQADAIQMIRVHFKNAFRGVGQNLATVNGTWQVSENDPTNVIRDSNEEISMTSGEPLRLEEGYELALKSIDIDGNRVYVELSKEGQVVDSSVMVPTGGSQITDLSVVDLRNEFCEYYAYAKDKGQADTAPIIVVHFKKSFRGAEQTFATVDSSWQISEINPTNVIRDDNDAIILTSEDPLRLEEGYELAIKSIDIDGNKVYVELSKDGQVVDSSVIRPPNNVEATYTYIEDKGRTGAVPDIEVHFKNSFRGADIELATIAKNIPFTGTPANNDAIAWCGKGNALYCQKRYDEAIQAYERAIELDQNLVYSWDGKGDALYYQERYDEALQAYEKVIELDPNSVNAWIMKGEVLNFLGRYDEALQAYEKAIELDPNSASAWCGKGNAFWLQNRYDEALLAYEKSIELDLNLANAWNGEGTVLNDQGKYDEAIKYYDEAIRLEPEVGLYWSNKGNALKASGKYNEADTAYAKAKELGYVDPGYKTLVNTNKG
jgi:tetratricopeptide (TPR) repeat protein